MISFCCHPSDFSETNTVFILHVQGAEHDPVTWAYRTFEMVHWLNIRAPDPVMVCIIFFLQFFLETVASIVISLLICLHETDLGLYSVGPDSFPLAASVALAKRAIWEYFIGIRVVVWNVIVFLRTGEND